jgi:hypothetical protein
LKFTTTTVASPIGLINLLIVVGIILSNTLVNVVWISSAYGQTVKPPFPEFPMIPSSSNTPGTNVTTKPSQPLPSSSVSQLSSSSTAHGVRITSPTKGQQVPAGIILTISGTSKDNAISDCHVNVIANDVKPYQNASAAGTGGANDYSNWTFSLTPKYTTIKEGANKITAKFSCNPNHGIASFYSVNVTGVLPRTLKGEGQVGTAPATTITNSSITAKDSTVIAPNQKWLADIKDYI